MKYYVYELADPRNGKVFYVGKGQANRIDTHERMALRGVAGRKNELIREIQAAGLKIIKTKIAEFDSAIAAHAREAELISKYGINNLINIVKPPVLTSEPDEELNRSASLTVRITSEMSDLIDAAATRAGMRRSDWTRTELLKAAKRENAK